MKKRPVHCFECMFIRQQIFLQAYREFPIVHYTCNFHKSEIPSCDVEEGYGFCYWGIERQLLTEID